MNAQERERPGMKMPKVIRRFGAMVLLLGAILSFTGCASMFDDEDGGSIDAGNNEHKSMTATHSDK